MFNLGNFGGQLTADELTKAYSTAGGNPSELGFGQQAIDSEVAGPPRAAQPSADVGALSQRTAEMARGALQASQEDEQKRKTKLLSTAASLAAAYFTGGASLAATGAGGAAAAKGGGGMLGGILGGVLGGGGK